MKRYIENLKSIPLFDGIHTSDIETLLGCISARLRHYDKNQIILGVGDIPGDVGIVLAGRVQIVKEDFYGNRTIVSEFGENNLFAESFASAGIKAAPVSVISVTPCKIMLINYEKILTLCSSVCSFHSKIIYNMLSIVSSKNLLLDQKIDVLSKRTTRDKLLAYLSIEAGKAGTPSFKIPFNRQQLADYLCVERSAMSAELGRMRKEGLIDFQRDSFTLHVKNTDVGE